MKPRTRLSSPFPSLPEIRDMMCVRVHAVEDIALLFRCMHSSSQPSVRRFLHNRHVLTLVLFDGEEREREKVTFCSSRNLSHQNVHLEVQRSVTLKWWREPSASFAFSRTAGTCVQARLQTVKVVQTVRVDFHFHVCSHFGLPCVNYVHDFCRIIPRTASSSTTHTKHNPCRARIQLKKVLRAITSRFHDVDIR